MASKTVWEDASSADRPAAVAATYVSAPVAQPPAPAIAARDPLWSPRPSTKRLLGPGTATNPAAISENTISVWSDGMARSYPWQHMRVTIFTGSRLGPRLHAEAAAGFAQELARAGIGMVFGGGRVGLMGVVADAALAAGGEVIGVIPQHLVDREVAHLGLTRLEVVADMHQRKARMAELGDAFVALPGAAGTLEELFEVWTWGQLGLHEKPSALLDVGGFYRPLIEQLGVMAAQGYLEQAQLDALGVVDDADEFLRFVRGYRHPPRKRLLMDEPG